ncbi:MAG: sigma-70 family RNA polymerase sigma factor [Rhodoplanes sp.]
MRSEAFRFVTGESECVSSSCCAPRQWAAMPNNAAVAESPRSWEQLIQAIATRRDRATFVKLFQHFAPRVKTFMLRSGASESAAEEIARQTMLSVWREADSFKPGAAGAAAAWIFTIARNLRIDALRRERRGGATDVASDNNGAEPQVDDRLTRESEVADAQIKHCVREAMAQLSNEQLREIERSFFKDKPESEIVALLGPRLRSLLGHTS